MELIKSTDIIYSEHYYDECFEYKNGSGRVPDGNAVGYEIESNSPNRILILFNDIRFFKLEDFKVPSGKRQAIKCCYR